MNILLKWDKFFPDENVKTQQNLPKLLTLLKMQGVGFKMPAASVKNFLKFFHLLSFIY